MSAFSCHLPSTCCRAQQGQRALRANFTSIHTFFARLLRPRLPCRSVPVKGCVLVPPERKDAIKVLVGDLAGQTGELVGTDGGDGIVKIAGDVKILSLTLVGKYVAPA